MKKIISLLLLLTLTLTVAGCKQKKNDEVAEIPKEEQAVAADNNETQQKETDRDSDDVQTEQKEQNEQNEYSDDVQTEQKEQNEQNEYQDKNDTISETEEPVDSETISPDESDSDGTFVIEEEPYVDGTELEIDFRMACIVGTDLFTAEVLSVHPLDSNTMFALYLNDVAAPVRYTVRVVKTYKDFVVTEGSTIDVIGYEANEPMGKYWFASPKVGSTYIFGGGIDILGDKPVVVTHGLVYSEVKEDGTLVPCSDASENALKDIKTLDEFEKSEDVSDVLYTATENILLDDRFYEYTNKKTAEEVKAVLKEAIKVDSDVKLNIK